MVAKFVVGSGSMAKARKHARTVDSKQTESREDYEIHTDYHLARWAVGVRVDRTVSVCQKRSTNRDLATSEGATEHERKRAEETAERLMAQHMIEEHELRKAAERSGKTANTPIVQDWSVNFAESANEAVADQWEFDHQILDMMMYVLDHCNVRVNRNYKYKSGQRIYQIVGFRDDITYAERIWFNVFKTFVSNVNPRWDVDKSLEFNAYTFASAGVSWKDQVLLAEKAKDDRSDRPLALSIATIPVAISSFVMGWVVRPNASR